MYKCSLTFLPHKSAAFPKRHHRRSVTRPRGRTHAWPSRSPGSRSPQRSRSLTSTTGREWCARCAVWGPARTHDPPPSGRFGFCGILYVRIIDVPYFGLRARTGWARCCSPTRPPKDGRRKQAVAKLDAFRSVQDAWAGRDGVPVSGVAGRGRAVAYVAGDRSGRWAICCRDRCAERAARVCCDVEKCRIIMYYC